MIVLICVLLMVAGFCMFMAAVTGYKAHIGPKKKILVVSNEVELSWPAQAILDMYNKLPEEHRPEGDMRAALEALDVKHQRGRVNVHFGGGYGYGEMYYGWRNHSCRNRACSYQDYYDLKDHVEGISKAIAEQRHALELTHARYGLEELESIKTRLREERSLIRSVTQEITQ